MIELNTIHFIAVTITKIVGRSKLYSVLLPWFKMTWFPLHTNPYFLVSISCAPIWGSFVLQFGDQLGSRILCGPIWGSFAMCSIVRTIWGPGSFALQCGDHLGSRIMCGPIWGSFGTCSNLGISFVVTGLFADPHRFVLHWFDKFFGQKRWQFCHS